MRKCRTRGNLPIGNLWLAGRSQTYLLWWMMGRPQDSCLTCQVSASTVVMRFFLQQHTSVYLMKTRSHEFSVETSAGAEQPPDFVKSSPPKYMFDASHFPQQLSYVKCYETGPRRWVRMFTEVFSTTVFAFYCHLVSWKRTTVTGALNALLI